MSLSPAWSSKEVSDSLGYLERPCLKRKKKTLLWDRRGTGDTWTPGGERLALLILCFSLPETVPLKTLQCYNDYTNRIICSWADTEDAQGLINMTLYHQLEK